MIDSIFVRASVLARLHRNPLQPHLEQLATTLHKQGYARSSIQNCVLAGDKFGWWLQRQGCVNTEIDETLLERYVAGLKRYRSGKRCKAAAGLNHLFRILRQQGVVVERQAATLIAPVDQWLARYEQYLEQVVGAAIGTRQRYRPIVRQFITKCCISGEIDWSSLCAQTITEFVCKQATARLGHGRKMPSVAVRSFLRFLVFEGEINIGLEAAAPTPPQWTHAALPVRLTSEQVERVLAVYHEKTPSSLRNRVMLLLLARLGLRAREVLILGLDDIDWYQGQLNIRPGKTHRARTLPLPQDVGTALVAYLEEGRPKGSTSRQIFLRCQPPFSPLTTSNAVVRVVRQALQRAGVVKQPHVVSHIFRHTATSQMLNQGASFKEVADILGHRSLQTTGIYGKLDLDALVSVALPWLGGAQ